MSWSTIYGIDLFEIAVFAVSYYRSCYRRGFKVDFWHAQLFLACVLPNMIMLPFARSELNALVVGRDFDGIIAVLPTIFLITSLGYFSILAGRIFWRLRVGLGLRRAVDQVLEVLPRCSRMLMSSRDLLFSQALLCFCLQAVALSYYFGHSGFGFNLRDYTFANPSLRPIALVISNYSVVIASHSFARYVDTKERRLLFGTMLLTFGLVFFGSRANLSLIYVNVGLCAMVARGRRLRLVPTVGLLTFLLLFVFYLGNVRAGDYSLGNFFKSIVFLLFYGNNFSDLRDFGWVYSAWDHVLWWGKTYLAGATAFIPRFASTFRNTWATGVAMDLTVGLDPEVHPGLRPGAFGESFFNFGWMGVLALGLFTGIVLDRLDREVKSAVQSSNGKMTRAFAATSVLTIAACASNASVLTTLYILLAIYAFSWILLHGTRLMVRYLQSSRTGGSQISQAEA